MQRIYGPIKQKLVPLILEDESAYEQQKTLPNA